MIRCLLWDFGDTLFDELSLWRASAEWMSVYRSFDDPNGVGAQWCLGRIGADEVAARIAPRVGLTAAEARIHLSRAELFEPFPATLAFFRAQHLPQAIVTVNPVLFRDLAAQLELDRSVDLMVISGEEGTVDKGDLCALALERMPESWAPSEALLIDNKVDSLTSWARHGGVGYHHRGDDRFALDAADGVEGLVRG